MKADDIRNVNMDFWNAHADEWFGTTALPTYGVHFVTEDELNLFGDVAGKKMLEICCGSGHSLAYHAARGAALGRRRLRCQVHLRAYGEHTGRTNGLF